MQAHIVYIQLLVGTIDSRGGQNTFEFFAVYIFMPCAHGGHGILNIAAGIQSKRRVENQLVANQSAGIIS